MFVKALSYLLGGWHWGVPFDSHIPAQPHQAGVMSVLINPNIATVQTSAGENGCNKNDQRKVNIYIYTLYT